MTEEMLWNCVALAVVAGVFFLITLFGAVYKFATYLEEKKEKKNE